MALSAGTSLKEEEELLLSSHIQQDPKDNRDVVIGDDISGLKDVTVAVSPSD